MNFIKTPTKGMRDFTPEEMKLREYVLKVMKETYENFGFLQIQTPIVEHIENLTSNQGGENEKLIFKILKRGEKLDLSSNDIVDCGLRYDLTVPLTRFYSGNLNILPSPFRAFQIGNVYRADRPQKGRFREFMQCDIDILGEKTNIAEIEVITAVVTFLKKLNFQNFTIKINDRRILNAMCDFVGFNDKEKVLISLDKLDKIGESGVREELSLHFEKDKINTFLNLFEEKDIDKFTSQINVEASVTQNLKEIMDITSTLTDAKIIFDPTLVRGMGYYTGCIFEIGVDELSSSMGGGGRYDHMIEKYTNMVVPACGFSIGFERLLLILQERNFIVPEEKEKLAYVITKSSNKKEIMKLVNEERKNKIVKILNQNKNYKYQKEELEKEHYKIIEK